MIKKAVPSDDVIRVLEEMEQNIFAHPWKREALSSHLASPVAITLLWWDKEEALGYLLGSFVAGEGEILRIGTQKDARRMGIGQELVLAFLEEVRREGGEKVFLEVREGNLAARALYEKNGFERSGTRRNYYSQPAEDAVLYEKNMKKEEKQ